MHTVEHVLAAVAGARARRRRDRDGWAGAADHGWQRRALSSTRLREAGIAEQAGEAQYLTLRAAGSCRRRRVGLRGVPASALELRCHDRLSASADRAAAAASIASRRDVFERELARARTFGFVREVDALRAKGLIRGASTENAVVLDDDGRRRERRCAGPTSSCGTRRWTASAISRWPARECRRAVVAIKPSHRGTVLLVRDEDAASEPMKERRDGDRIWTSKRS